MLVTLLVNLRNNDSKTRELEFLLQPMPVGIVTFVKSLGSHLNFKSILTANIEPGLPSCQPDLQLCASH